MRYGSLLRKNEESLRHRCASQRGDSMTLAPENIPQELMDKRQWVNWDLVIRDGKQTKVPKQPNGRNADSTDPGTWSDFETCVGALENGSRFRGIGFVFNHDYTGTDFDDCVKNGEITNPDVIR